MKNKIVSLHEFLSIKEKELTDKTIVFTNGCFDILHPGHTDYLTKAKELGNILVLGINTDESVSRLKGTTRPIQNLEARSLVLSALESIDYVISFNEDTPIDLIKAIKPSLLVKGGDYTQENIVGAEFVLSYGGVVKIIPFLEGYSTSKIINKINK